MSTNVEQIKERLNIVDVISSYLKIEKAGINYKARCPFHNEKTPSFFISPQRQSFYCFGCGEKGDIFSFVEKFENVDFKEAMKILAERAGIELKGFRKEENKDEKEELLKVMEVATKFYEEALVENKNALQYLKNRGLLPDSISKWRIGFAKEGWRNLYDFLTEKGFSQKTMLEAGLLKKTEGKMGSEDERYYDTFRNRIMFPIFDNNGKVIAFSGRAMREDEKNPKYLNSPETKLFYKSETLYGFHIAKNYIRKNDYTVLVEGQMDLLMSHQVGTLNTVASSGTALTELHLKKLQKLSNRIIIAYDSDEAGESAARRAAELALSLGMEVKTTFLPKNEDPDSIIRKNPSEWKEILKNSEYFLDALLSKALQKYKDRALTKEITNNILPLVSLIKNEIEKSHFIKKIALKMRVTEDTILKQLEKIKTDTARVNSNEENQNQKDQKEELLFEIERYGLKIDVEQENAEILKRDEIKELKKKHQEIAITLDDKDITQEDRKNLENDLKNIEKRLKEINN
ncbi:MAG: DNA primase [Parcubacteria group bacterium]|jgi:DNA primase|nr:DNA primase [Parcubacteria group bacterium]